MECRLIRFGEAGEAENRHSELFAHDPELASPPFPSNPVASDPDFPFLFYCVENGTVLGSRRAIPDIVYREGASYPIAWCYDTIVSPAARGKGIGTRLVSLQVDEFERRNELSAAAFSAAAMMRIYEKLGYRVLGFVPRYALIRDTAPFLRKKLANPALARLAAIPANLALSARYASTGLQSFDESQLTTIDDQGWRRLWSEIPTVRNTYNWDEGADWSAARIQRQDSRYIVRSARDDRVLALFVLRHRAPPCDGTTSSEARLTMVHYKYDGSPEGARTLAKALAALLYRTKASVADIVTSDPCLQSQLKRFGYSRRDDGMTFVFKEPSGFSLPAARDQADWKLTHFCSDGFLFP